MRSFMEIIKKLKDFTKILFYKPLQPKSKFLTARIDIHKQMNDKSIDNIHFFKKYFTLTGIQWFTVKCFQFII